MHHLTKSDYFADRACTSQVHYGQKFNDSIKQGILLIIN